MFASWFPSLFGEYSCLRMQTKLHRQTWCEAGMTYCAQLHLLQQLTCPSSQVKNSSWSKGIRSWWECLHKNIFQGLVRIVNICSLDGNAIHLLQPPVAIYLRHYAIFPHMQASIFSSDNYVYFLMHPNVVVATTLDASCNIGIITGLGHSNILPHCR